MSGCSMWAGIWDGEPKCKTCELLGKYECPYPDDNDLTFVSKE